MHAAATTLADFAGRDICVKSAFKTQSPAVKKAGAPTPAFNRIIFRYGLAVGSVAAAKGLGFLGDRWDLHESVFTIFLLAVALTSWDAGASPAVNAFVLGELVLAYIFTPQLHNFRSTLVEITYYP